MAGDDRTGNSEIWKSINSRMNEAEIKQKILQKSVLEEPDGSLLERWHDLFAISV